MRIACSTLLLILTSWCSAQTFSVVETGEPYDTVPLSHGCALIYSTTKTLRVVQFIGPGIDTIIMAESLDISKDAVGYLGADFDNHFILYIGFDESTTKWMHIINKHNGKKLHSGTLITTDTLHKVSYFEDFDKRNMLSLFDFGTGNIERYVPPMNPCLHWWYCIKRLAVTHTQLTLEYTGTNSKTQTRVYTR